MTPPEEPRVRSRGEAELDVRACPGGPLLVRGAARVSVDDDTWHDTTRPVSAVCRCGASALRPWCDGTHKVLSRRGVNPLEAPSA
mgnify:CR=1 FL=1